MDHHDQLRRGRSHQAEQEKQQRINEKAKAAEATKKAVEEEEARKKAAEKASQELQKPNLLCQQATQKENDGSFANSTFASPDFPLMGNDQMRAFFNQSLADKSVAAMSGSIADNMMTFAPCVDKDAKSKKFKEAILGVQAILLGQN